MGAEEEFAKELAKQLPVKAIYEDAGAPAAKQTGQLLADIVKTVQLALGGIQYLGALRDRYRNFLDKSVRRVPPERQISPPPQILGPVLEGIKYEPEGTPIDEMFSQLLSRSMDKDGIAHAHPAYPLIINQLSSDEAKLLVLLRDRTYRFVQTWRFEGGLSHPDKVEVDELPREVFTFPQNVQFYMEHLNQLGLAGIFEVPPQEPLFNPASGRLQSGSRAKYQYRLTQLGTRFVQACARKVVQS
jgi:hypothetical protein